jgi:hypothetical protein
MNDPFQNQVPAWQGRPVHLSCEECIFEADYPCERDAMSDARQHHHGVSIRPLSALDATEFWLNWKALGN